MKKELSKVRESRVLFEPPEPLFGDLPPRKRMVPRVLVFCIVLGLVIGFWAFAASGADEEQGSDSSPYDSTEAIAESERESITEAEELTERYTESPKEETESEKKPDLESETVTETETAPPIREIDMSEIERGEEYVVSYTDKVPDITGLIDRGFLGEETAGATAPIIMILHTHTSEDYIKNDTTPVGGVVSVGDVLSASLNALGLSTLHCTVIHDGGEGNAYLEARETIKTMLKIYPSIKYVIDLHRMELEIDGETVKTVSGCEDGSAQIRLTVSADSGSSWQESLSLALALRQSLNQNGARLCMPAVISQSRYNSDLADYYLMVDIGASGNTIAEARSAAVRLANAIADVILAK